MKPNTTSEPADPLEITIGKFSICLDVNDDGDLQIRVYPIDDAGQSWDCPIDVFDVYRSDVDEAEIMAAEEAAEGAT